MMDISEAENAGPLVCADSISEAIVRWSADLVISDTGVRGRDGPAALLVAGGGARAGEGMGIVKVDKVGFEPISERLRVSAMQA